MHKTWKITVDNSSKQANVETESIKMLQLHMELENMQKLEAERLNMLGNKLD